MIYIATDENANNKRARNISSNTTVPNTAGKYVPSPIVVLRSI